MLCAHEGEGGAERFERLFVTLARQAGLVESFSSTDFIGHGTYGHVYAASLAGGSQCAVKLFLSPHTSLTSARRELACLATLGRASERNRNVCQLLDCGTLRGFGVAYLVMPLYMPLDLSVLRDQAAAFDFIDAVLSGLDHVHAHGFVHRDIKPNNIVYDRANGTFVIIDFGLAMKRGPTGSRGGGSWGYRGPEHVLGSCCALASTDLWSFGIMVLHLLHGEATPAMPQACQRSAVAELERVRDICGERALRALAEQLGVSWPPDDARGGLTGERTEQLFAPTERVFAFSGDNVHIRSLAEALLAPQPAHRIAAAIALERLRAFRSNAQTVLPVCEACVAPVAAVGPPAPVVPVAARRAACGQGRPAGVVGQAAAKRATARVLIFARAHECCNHVFNV